MNWNVECYYITTLKLNRNNAKSYIRVGDHLYLCSCYATAFEPIFGSRYPTARRTVHMTNKVRKNSSNRV